MAAADSSPRVASASYSYASANPFTRDESADGGCWGLVRPDGPAESSAHILHPPTPAASFRRVGYETRWRLPVSDNTLLNIRHAGLWNHPDGADGDFHTLWDPAPEVDMGGVTYLVGCQRGSAAPLFVPIETTRAGLSFAVGGDGG